MVNFSFLPMDESKVAPEHRKQFLTIGQLVRWGYADASGTYSGLIIVGEKAISQGFQTFADVTIDIGVHPLPMSKIQELNRIVSTEYRQRAVIQNQKPGNA